jgi:hypothetical protein
MPVKMFSLVCVIFGSKRPPSLGLSAFILEYTQSQEYILSALLNIDLDTALLQLQFLITSCNVICPFCISTATISVEVTYLVEIL